MSDITSGTLRIIRMAMLAGVVLFGAVAFWVNSQSGMDQMTSDSPLGYASVALVLAAAATVMIVRRRTEGMSFRQRAKWYIAAAGACEAAAIVGGVLLMLSGYSIPYFAALIIFGFSLLLLPDTDGS